ncbi:MAG: hypothetical protein IJU48_01600 [Synergistaceae bacterium]|nr:hypothetical protein [Synergistaceae bacterium]
MRIYHNFPALTAFNALNSTNKSLRKVINSLSTGLRINSSSDDAAGFAMCEKMRSQISGLNTASRNTQDGISMLQTAEGALSQTNSMLQRMRELAVQAANDSLTSNDRQYLQLEINEIKGEIDRIADTTQFNRKRLLDGSCGALWSSSDLNVKAKINGGLEYTDQFGQKVSSEGNYRIEISAEPGQPQVQKSNIFNLGREEVITKTEIVRQVTGYTSRPYEININDGVDSLGNASGEGWRFANNTLTITENGTYCIVGNTQATKNHVLVNPNVNATIFLRDVNINTGNDNTGNISQCAFYMKDATVDMYLDGDNILASGGHRAGIEAPEGSTLTISSAAGDYSTDGTLKASSTYDGAGIGGGCNAYVRAPYEKNGGKIIIKGGTIEATCGSAGAGIGGGWGGTAGDISIEGGKITATGGYDGAGIGSGSSSSNGNSTITIKGGDINANGGTDAAGIGGGYYSTSGSITINTGLSISTTGYIEPQNTVSIGCGLGGLHIDGEVKYESMTLDPARTIPDLPRYDAPDVEILTETTEQRYVTTSTLADIKTFYNSDSVFLVKQPQPLTITQGDGKTAQVTLYSTDTMKDVADKINDAIANSLGQRKYVDNVNNFCTLASGPENTSEAVFSEEEIYFEENEEDIDIPEGSNVISHKMKTRRSEYDIYSTMLIRSAIPGKSGELYFLGDEDLLRALGLNTIQASSKTTYTASVYDAHTGQSIAQNVKSSAPEFPSLIPPEIDIEVDMMSGLSANWDENSKRFIMARKDAYTTFLHLKNNGTIFQIGANRGEDFMVQLGDASCDALNLSSVNVATRETASRSIGILDRAINRVASQRAKIGAYDNALERTMNTLTITSTNLMDAKSRISDADIAASFMDFVKLQILNQSGTSMLAQANQLPQSVMNLLQ